MNLVALIFKFDQGEEDKWINMYLNTKDNNFPNVVITLGAS